MVIGDGQRFVLALHDSGERMTWDEAMNRYGSSLPSKAQGEVMAKQYEAINEAIIAFGGDKDPAFFYWTKDEYDSSSACTVNMGNGYVGSNTKSYTYRVRAVAPVPSSSAM